jgi:hypothetical protein
MNVTLRSPRIAPLSRLQFHLSPDAELVSDLSDESAMIRARRLGGWTIKFQIDQR